MQNNGDRQIVLNVPFLKEGTVLLVSDHDWSGSHQDCKFVFLPDLVESLNVDLCQYLFPGGQKVISTENMCRRIREQIGLGDEDGLLYRRHGVLFFHVLAASLETSFETEINRFLVSLQDSPAALEKAGARKAQKTRYFDIVSEDSAQDDNTIRFSIKGEEEEEPDPRVQAILDAWRKIEREFGITIEDLEVFLGYKVKLSRLTITTSGKIFLPDFDNQEVKMDDLTKALYFFFLRHPKGARLKELYEHEDEITKIYFGITGRDDPKKIRESVRNLLAPYGNALNVSMSRIKKAFKDVMSDRIARFYYVSGRSGEIRNIGLDRDLVIWEH